MKMLSWRALSFAGFLAVAGIPACNGSPPEPLQAQVKPKEISVKLDKYAETYACNSNGNKHPRTKLTLISEGKPISYEVKTVGMRLFCCNVEVDEAIRTLGTGESEEFECQADSCVDEAQATFEVWDRENPQGPKRPLLFNWTRDDFIGEEDDDGGGPGNGITLSQEPNDVSHGTDVNGSEWLVFTSSTKRDFVNPSNLDDRIELSGGGDRGAIYAVPPFTADWVLVDGDGEITARQDFFLEDEPGVPMPSDEQDKLTLNGGAGTRPVKVNDPQGSLRSQVGAVPSGLLYYGLNTRQLAWLRATDEDPPRIVSSSALPFNVVPGRVLSLAADQPNGVIYALYGEPALSTRYVVYRQQGGNPAAASPTAFQAADDARSIVMSQQFLLVCFDGGRCDVYGPDAGGIFRTSVGSFDLGGSPVRIESVPAEASGGMDLLLVLHADHLDLVEIGVDGSITTVGTWDTGGGVAKGFAVTPSGMVIVILQGETTAPFFTLDDMRAGG